MRYVDHCLRCDRPLRSKKARQDGAGEKCKRILDSKLREVLDEFHAWQVRKALDAISAGAFSSCGRGNFVVQSSKNPDEIYAVSVRHNVCTCQAGEHGVKCYHLAGARLLTK